MTTSDQTPLSILVTASGNHQLTIVHADSFTSRLRGLLFVPPLMPGHGMLLMRCTSVHTCFMRQRLDLLYLDSSGRVTKCVSGLRPWRVSDGCGPSGASPWVAGACHVLELAAGSITAMAIEVGSEFRHPALTVGVRPQETSSDAVSDTACRSRQNGSAMIEFAVVAPLITLLGLACIQYGLLFFAKNNYNHAAFMAARAGTTGNANLKVITDAYTQALIPLNGGGTNAAELAASLVKARKAVADHVEIRLLNPTAESFADFNDVALQKALGLKSERVIPNGGLSFRKAAIIPPGSGQNIQDANLLKLRITHGYRPQVPVVGAMYRRYLQWLDPGTDKFATGQIRDGLIPVVMNVTLLMQSDAIEGITVSTPGMGNGGAAINPGTPPVRENGAPACNSILCAPPEGAGSAGAGSNGPEVPGASAGEPGSDGGAPGGACPPPPALV